MPVRIYKPSPTGGVNIPPGTQQPSSFKDLFTRANSSNLGPAWMQYLVTTGSSGSQLNASIVGNLCSIIASASGTYSGLVAPVPLAWMSQRVQNQFAEITIGAIGGTGFQMGPCCVVAPGISANATNQGCYLLSWNNTNLQIFKFVWTGVSSTGSTQTSLLTIAQTVTVGDVLRLTATNVSGTWTLTAFKNGTSIGSTTDSVLTQGMPGYFCVTSAATPFTVTISEFAGGRV